MIKNLLLSAALFASIGAQAQPASYKERAQQYILQYKDLAQEEQRRSGVPAAITLAQGILETDAGRSDLAVKANNHFGIKCKKEWTGETFAHDDDAPQECFRKYSNSLQSYKDHSDYLKNSKRYQPCFAQRTDDYASWARELRKCGYATNPKYSQLLIKIVEEYRLQDYTYAAMNAPDRPVFVASAASPVASAKLTESAQKHDTPAKDEEKPVYGQVIRRDGARGFYAHKGDVLLEYAIQYKVRYAKILEINNLPDAPLASDMFVYIEKGSRISQIMSRDASAPAPPAIQDVPVAKESAPVVIATAPVAAPPAAVVEPEKVVTPIPTTPPIPEKVVAEPVTTPAVEEKKVNIADEVAIEETPAAEPFVADDREVEVEVEKPAPVPEEPQDEFSRLKARLDKAVYAPSSKPAPRQSPVAQPAVVEPPTTPVLAAAGGKVFHTVKSGETAFGIAKKYGVSMKELMALNDLNFQAIKIGQKLRVK